jgi:hypothetical protein
MLQRFSDCDSFKLSFCSTMDALAEGNGEKSWGLFPINAEF